MNVTKYADLSQSLAESEKQLYDKISEECASNFQIAIHDSLNEIESNVNLMTEVVNKIQSCKDSYGEAAELVKSLSATLTDTEKNVIGLNNELEKVSELASSSTSDISEKVASLLKLSDNLTEKNKENENLIDEACKNIKTLGDEYSSTIESVMKDANNLGDDINRTKETIMECTKRFLDGSSLFSSKTDDSIVLLNNVSTGFESLKSGLDLLFESINSNKDILISVTDKIKGTTDKITTVSNYFCQLEERIDDYNKRVIDKVEEHLKSIINETEVIVSQTNKFSELLLRNTAEVTELIERQKTWEISCEDSFASISKKVDELITDLVEKKNVISSETKAMQDCQIVIESCVNDVKKRTAEYAKTVQDANLSIIKSFDLFKIDFLSTYDEQSKIIGDIKEEQVKLKKMCLLGMIPVVIVIILQIVNIIC